MLIFSLHVGIFQMKFPFVITVIARHTPLVFIVVVVRGGCFPVFSIWNNTLIGDPLWFFCWIVVWVTNRTIFIVTAVPLDMDIIAKLIISHILPGIWHSTRYITISTTATLKINLLQILVDQLLNCHSICIIWLMMFLKFLLYGGRFPSILINKVVVLIHSLLCKVHKGDEILWFYDTQIKHTGILNKIHNLLVVMNPQNTKYEIAIILKYVIDVSKLIGIKGPGNIMLLSVYQDFSTSIWNNIPSIFIQFETIQVVKSLLQIIVGMEMF